MQGPEQRGGCSRPKVHWRRPRRVRILQCDALHHAPRSHEGAAEREQCEREAPLQGGAAFYGRHDLPQAPLQL